MCENRDRGVRIIPEMIYRAQENIISRRNIHIDVLIDKLKEECVRNVIEPILSGQDGEVKQHQKDDDIQYVVDMGLIVRDTLRVANAICREIIPRELTWARQQTLNQQSAWYMDRCAPDAEGHLVIFNRDKGVVGDKKLWYRTEQYVQDHGMGYVSGSLSSAAT